MANNCTGCGAELFAGQRFCRVCGRPTGELHEVDSPTQMMPPSAVPPPSVPLPGGAAAGRAPTGRETSPTAAQTAPVPQYSQPQYRPGPPAVPMYVPPKKGGPWGWIISFIGIGIFAIVVIAVLAISHAARRERDRLRESLRRSVSGPAVSDPSRKAGEQDFLQSGASGTRTFPLDTDATFSVTNINGTVTIEAWDQQQAQVTVSKNGNGSDVTGLPQVVFNGDEDNFSLRTLGGSDQASLKYEIKVPRTLEKLVIKEANGRIDVSGVEGKIIAELQNGAIRLNDIKGSASAKTKNGSINATFDSVNDDDDPLDFTSDTGGIKLQFKGDFDADLDAQTRVGGIHLEGFDIPVEKVGLLGQEAHGKIGDGGRPLSAKTGTGGIEIQKVQ